MSKIAIIEDDCDIRTVLRLSLKGAGFSKIYEAERGDTGLKMVLNEKPDLVLLDIMLPGMDGLSVCREIRSSQSIATTPIIILTAKAAEDDIVRGLELGADDYITKPFSKAILLARIKAALRRPEAAQTQTKNLDGLVLDVSSRSISLSKTPISLTRSEFDLLNLLISHPSRVYTRPQIITAIQSDEKDVTDRTVDTLMVGLRRKLGEWASHIETIRGIGYRLS